jgi:hypothetical protein
MLHRSRKRESPSCVLFLLVAVLSACSDNEAPDDDVHSAKAPEIARIVPARDALAGAYVPTLDPMTMNEAEIRKVLKIGPWCEFRYTSTGKPVLAIGMQSGQTALNGVIKLNGNLAVLTGASDGGGKQGEHFVLHADPVRVSVVPHQPQPDAARKSGQRREANMIFEVGQRLKVGYRGYLHCTSEPPT